MDGDGWMEDDIKICECLAIILASDDDTMGIDCYANPAEYKGAPLS